MTPPVVRFAPSPTGNIHIGNVRPALLNWLFAKKQNGTFILRYDDTDQARSKKAYADAILTDLNWLGIEPDRIEWQSKNVAAYQATAEKLKADGLLYPCYETPDQLDRRRKRARAMGKPPIYDRAALELSEAERAELEAQGLRPHWRFKLQGKIVTFTDLVRGEQKVDTASMSDPVLIREDGSFLYTLPSVIDDIAFGITHIVRGEDHVANTGTQIELFEALGGTPPIFAHHNLLTDKDGKGLSKRLGSLSIGALREAGLEPLAVAIHAVLIGTSLPVAPYDSLDAVADQFNFSMISRAPARFDEAELEGLNAKLLHGLSYEDVKERLAELNLIDPESFWHAVQPNLSKFSEIAEWQALIAGPVTPEIASEDAEFITQAAGLLPAEPWDDQTWKSWTGAVKEASARKGKQLFLPLRLALTGRRDGPELKTLLPLLGRKVCLDRLGG